MGRPVSGLAGATETNQTISSTNESTPSLPNAKLRSNMVTDHFDQGADRHPDRVCVQAGPIAMTYAEVQAASHAIGHALGERGFASAHIALLAPNDPLGFVAMLGVLRSGATYVPLNAREGIDDLIWFLRFARVSLLVVHSQFLEHVARFREGVPSLKSVIGLDTAIEGASIDRWMQDYEGQRCSTRRGPDDIALIKSTGGTTGRPKAVMQSHGALLTSYRVANQLTIPAGEVNHLIVAPMTHAAGTNAMALSGFAARHIIAASPDPATVLEAIERERVTHVFLTPTQIYRLLAHPDTKTRDCSSLECVIYGAAPMSVEKLREAISLWGPVFLQFYGMSEVPGMITCLTREDHRRDGKHLASAGRPTGVCEVALMDADGKFVGPSQPGEIVLRGSLIGPGYYDNLEATAEARPFGWHRTGDVGVFDEGGYLYIVDRVKDLIISGGFNIYPNEIEQLIWSHPAVQDCAVVGVLDPDWGELVTAVVELKPGASVSESEILELCKQRFGSLKVPKRVEFWSALPRSPVGKVLKKAVRARLHESSQGAVSK
ncbi:MAG: AMP-binding protein [Rubrivivax sp.]